MATLPLPGGAGEGFDLRVVRSPASQSQSGDPGSIPGSCTLIAEPIFGLILGNAAFCFGVACFAIWERGVVCASSLCFSAFCCFSAFSCVLVRFRLFKFACVGVF